MVLPQNLKKPKSEDKISIIQNEHENPTRYYNLRGCLISTYNE